jgi:hypothetical protein
VGVRTYEEREEPRTTRPAPPPFGAAILVAVVVLLGLLANGRPIGAEERASLSWLAGAATWPILAAARLAFAPDAVGLALAGKLASSFYCALAAGLLFLAVTRRRAQDDAWLAALVFAFGTTVWASAQRLSANPVATALVACALLFLVLGEDEAAWEPRAALPLGLAFAANPADLLLVGTLAFSVVMRRPRQIGLWVLWALPGLALVAIGGSGTGLSAFDAGPEWGTRLLALWAGPADGLLVFAPVALVGLAGVAKALRREDAPLAAGCAAAFVVHGTWIAGRPPAAGDWGTGDWTDAMPLLLLFLPEGRDLMRGLGTALVALSVAIQAMGAFAYDLRWDRLFAATPEARRSATLDLRRSPIPFTLRERVLILALPRIHEGKAWIAGHRVVFGAPSGSRLSAAGPRLLVEGSDPTFDSAHLVGGATVREGRIRLAAPGDTLFLRVLEKSRARRLELRVAGRGRGTLVVGESTFWAREARLHERPVAGEFRIELPYHYPESGGGDLTLSVWSGSVEVTSVRLVPPTEPENVIRLGPTPAP